MSVTCGVGTVMVIGCLRWAWKRCSYVGSDDSETWPNATMEEFEPIPRICRVILAVYEPDSDPDRSKYPSSSDHFRFNHENVFKRATDEETQGHSPPYIIYLDHENREIVLAIRGLNLSKERDYKILLDNKLGRQMFDGGYVHHGLLKSALWLLNQESQTLKRLWLENGENYRMVFAGHSLGSGIAALLTVMVVNHRDKIGGIPRGNIRCYAVAPARCMSLNLAVKYADVIHSVILQDDFLPRTPTPLEDIFESIFCDTFVPEDAKLNDPRRLYVPGRLYHIVERRFCRCGRYPPEVRTAIPVDGRFEHIVLSSNATSDHEIIWIAKEAEKALQLLKERSQETLIAPPVVPRFERLQTIEKEHRSALERAFSLNIPHAVTVKDEGDSTEKDPGPVARNCEDAGGEDHRDEAKASHARVNWNELVEKLFKNTESGHLIFTRDGSVVNK